VTYLYARGPHDVLVVVNSTRDEFGPRVWQRLRCTSVVVPDGELGWSNCSAIGRGKPSWLRPIPLTP
jgi:hypothetical protein